MNELRKIMKQLEPVIEALAQIRVVVPLAPHTKKRGASYLVAHLAEAASKCHSAHCELRQACDLYESRELEIRC